MHLDIERKVTRQVYLQLAEVCKGYGHARRLELLDLLAQGAYSVEELAREMGISVASTSQHLQILRTARIVEVERKGVKAYYRIAHPDVYRLLQSLYRLGQSHLVELNEMLNRHLPDCPGAAILSMQELQDRLAVGGVCVVDVRPEKEFLSGHIPGAISLPLVELPQHLHELPAASPIVAYCRGPFSVLADLAVHHMQEHGLAAQRLEWGFAEWVARGLPIEISTAQLESG